MSELSLKRDVIWLLRGIYYANLRHFQECLSLQPWDENLYELAIEYSNSLVSADLFFVNFTNTFFFQKEHIYMYLGQISSLTHLQ